MSIDFDINRAGRMWVSCCELLRILTALQDVVDSVGVINRCSGEPVDRFGLNSVDRYSKSGVDRH
ncbi:hypothetical protein F2Q68_00045364 [Brassica cretica]|uniref:Uncharacterized protein n=1 Tax=Brassica cretica TaxID=69181 RepID=A0A8S9LV04_BRACR|nr:hypothetical protein F2Q68_00045364 [Brassica cretica]